MTTPQTIIVHRTGCGGCIVVLLLIIVILMLTGCDGKADAKRVLEEEGYTQVEMTGYRWTGCSEDDFYHEGFKATTVAGRRVSGVVCGGNSLFGKSWTIRRD